MIFVRFANLFCSGGVTHGKFLPFVIVKLVGKIGHPTFHLRHLADFLLRFPGEFWNLPMYFSG